MLEMLFPVSPHFPGQRKPRHLPLTNNYSSFSFSYVILSDPSPGLPIDACKPTDGSDFKGERLTVQFARGPRRKENFPGPMDRPNMPRPRRTIFRMLLSGLPETSWQVSSPSPLSLGINGRLEARLISVP